MQDGLQVTEDPERGLQAAHAAAHAGQQDLGGGRAVLLLLTSPAPGAGKTTLLARLLALARRGSCVSGGRRGGEKDVWAVAGVLARRKTAGDGDGGGGGGEDGCDVEPLIGRRLADTFVLGREPTAGRGEGAGAEACGGESAIATTVGYDALLVGVDAAAADRSGDVDDDDDGGGGSRILPHSELVCTQAAPVVRSPAALAATLGEGEAVLSTPSGEFRQVFGRHFLFNLMQFRRVNGWLAEVADRLRDLGHDAEPALATSGSFASASKALVAIDEYGRIEAQEEKFEGAGRGLREGLSSVLRSAAARAHSMPAVSIVIAVTCRDNLVESLCTLASQCGVSTHRKYAVASNDSSSHASDDKVVDAVFREVIEVAGGNLNSCNLLEPVLVPQLSGTTGPDVSGDCAHDQQKKPIGWRELSAEERSAADYPGGILAHLVPANSCWNDMLRSHTPVRSTIRWWGSDGAQNLPLVPDATPKASGGAFQRSNPWLFPSKDGAALAIARRQEELRALGWRILSCDENTVVNLSDKVRLNDLAARKGLLHSFPARYALPGQQAPSGRTAAVFPCILKRCAGAFGQTVHIVRSSAEIAEIVSRSGGKSSKKKKLDADTACGKGSVDETGLDREWLLQELVRGRIEFSTSLLVRDGVILDAVLCEYEYDQEEYVWPNVRQVRCDSSRKIPAEHLEVMRHLLNDPPYSGICNFNYKLRQSAPRFTGLSPDGGLLTVDASAPLLEGALQMCIFEVNVRVGGDLACDASRAMARDFFEKLNSLDAKAVVREQVRHTPFLGLVEHDGAVVPVLLFERGGCDSTCGCTNTVAQELRERGAEVLDDATGALRLLVYIKEYSEEEMQQSVGGLGKNFHRGYSLEMFLESFSGIWDGEIDFAGIEPFLPFLSSRAVSLLTGQRKAD